MLVGRDRQVRQLRTHLDALAVGRGGLLLIAGEGGIGKTRLTEEAIRLANEAGVDAQRVTCWAEAGAPPFWPWSQLLRALGSADAAARDAYKHRLVELDAEIDAADRAADVGRSEQLHAERDALISELSASFGLGGRSRRAGDPAERARSAVTQRIRDALGRVDAEHADLGGHLRRAVKTGMFCVYEPDGPVEWEISQP